MRLLPDGSLRARPSRVSRLRHTMVPQSAFRDMQFTPWWWEWAPRRECSEPGESGESGGLGEAGEPRLPSEAEVAVIGSGFTALSAALTLAREGREVVVIEAGAPGFGASTRNGGQVGSGNQRFTVRALIARFGEAQARALLAEGRRGARLRRRSHRDGADRLSLPARRAFPRRQSSGPPRPPDPRHARSIAGCGRRVPPRVAGRPGK